jgi:hypothetical protein
MKRRPVFEYSGVAGLFFLCKNCHKIAKRNCDPTPNKNPVTSFQNIIGFAIMKSLKKAIKN